MDLKLHPYWQKVQISTPVKKGSNYIYSSSVILVETRGIIEVVLRGLISLLGITFNWLGQIKLIAHWTILFSLWRHDIAKRDWLVASSASIYERDVHLLWCFLNNLCLFPIHLPSNGVLVELDLDLWHWLDLSNPTSTLIHINIVFSFHTWRRHVIYELTPIKIGVAKLGLGWLDTGVLVDFLTF